MYLQNVFILLIPANCTAYVHAQKKSPWNTLSFSNRNCSVSPFTIRFRLQLVQPLQNGRLIFPRCISANHPVFPIIKEQFQNITNAFYRCSFSEQLEELHDSLHINLFRASGNAIVGLADQLLIKASLLNIFADFSNRQLFFPD